MVKIHDYGSEPGGRLYLAMEFCEGDSLAAKLRSETHFSCEQSISYCRQALTGLEAAHAVGIIHRDLKPDNLIVSSQDSIWVVDFGLAKEHERADSEPTLTKTGIILGTPSYMSPEQSNGQPCDARSDIYAIGVVLYECLCGERPFHGNPLEILLQHMNDPPPSLRARARFVPPRLERIVLKALAKDPDDRWQSASDFRAALEAFATEAPLLEEEPRPPQRLWLLFAVTGVLSLIGVVGWVLQASPLSPPASREASPSAGLRQETRPSPFARVPSPRLSPSPTATTRPSARTPDTGQKLRLLLELRLRELRAALREVPRELRSRRLGQACDRVGANLDDLEAHELAERLERAVSLAFELEAHLRDVRLQLARQVLARRISCGVEVGVSLAGFITLSPTPPTEVRRRGRAALHALRAGDLGAARELSALGAQLRAKQRSRRSRVERARDLLLGSLSRLEASWGDLDRVWHAARDEDFPGPAQIAIVRRLAQGPQGVQPEPGSLLAGWAELRRWSKRLEDVLATHTNDHAALRTARQGWERLLRLSDRPSRKRWERRAAAIKTRDPRGRAQELERLTHDLRAEREKRAREAGDLRAIGRALKDLARAFEGQDATSWRRLPGRLPALARRTSRRRLAFGRIGPLGLNEVRVPVQELSFLDRESGRQSQLTGYWVLVRREQQRWVVAEFTNDP